MIYVGTRVMGGLKVVLVKLVFVHEACKPVTGELYPRSRIQDLLFRGLG